MVPMKMQNAVSTPLPKFFIGQPKSFRWMSDSARKNNFCFEIFFTRIFHWTSKMKFWQPCQWKLFREPKFFCPMSQKDEKIVFESKNFRSMFEKIFRKFLLEKQILPPEFSYGHVECSFYKPSGSFLSESRSFFSQCPKKFLKNYIPFSNKLFFIR